MHSLNSTCLKTLDPFRGASVLITGGLGFIGSNLAHKLIEIGDVKVTIVDALNPGQGGNLFNIEDIKDSVSIRMGDIGDEDTSDELVRGKSYIFNLAGNVSHVDSMETPLQDLYQNVTSHLTLLEACRKHKSNAKIVFASTRQIYGRPRYLPLDESHPLCPIDVNGINKASAETYHFFYGQLYGLRVVCLRLTNTFGPRQLIRHDRQSVIAWFIRQAVLGGDLRLFGGGEQIRDFNFVEDVVDALLLSALSDRADGHVFNLGGEKPTRLSSLAHELVAITGRGAVSSIPFPTERRGIEIGTCFSSYQKIKAQLGWHPRVSLSDGLKRTVRFYESHISHYL